MRQDQAVVFQPGVKICPRALMQLRQWQPVDPMQDFVCLWHLSLSLWDFHKSLTQHQHINVQTQGHAAENTEMKIENYKGKGVVESAKWNVASLWRHFDPQIWWRQGGGPAWWTPYMWWARITGHRTCGGNRITGGQELRNCLLRLSAMFSALNTRRRVLLFEHLYVPDMFDTLPRNT